MNLKTIMITLFILNQAFVDTIRNSGGSKIERLLIVEGAYDDLDMTSSLEYKFPIDPSNKLVISLYIIFLHYFYWNYILSHILGLMMMALNIIMNLL